MMVKEVLRAQHRALCWGSALSLWVRVSVCQCGCLFKLKPVFVFSFTQKLRGTVEALYVLCKCNNTRFEFIFTNLVSIYGFLISFHSLMSQSSQSDNFILSFFHIYKHLTSPVIVNGVCHIHALTFMLCIHVHKCIQQTGNIMIIWTLIRLLQVNIPACFSTVPLTTNHHTLDKPGGSSGLPWITC